MRNALPVILAVLVLLAGCQSNPFAPSKPAAQAAPQGPQIQPAQQVQLYQDPVTNRQRAEIHTELAAGYYERTQMNVALDELAMAEKFDPTYARIYNLYGLVYTVIGELPRAEAQFKRALELAPNDAEARHNWGWYLCTHGRERESIAEFEVAIRDSLYKTPEIALVNAGKCSAAIGDLSAADNYFRRALQLRPNDPSAAYNLALLSFKGGRLPESRALMKIVLQQSSSPAPEALFLGMCIERKLGDRQSEQSYVAQLRNRYPDSAETRAIATGACE
jgi:type IV pilus assembly protein PilF